MEVHYSLITNKRFSKNTFILDSMIIGKAPENVFFIWSANGERDGGQRGSPTLAWPNLLQVLNIFGQMYSPKCVIDILADFYFLLLFPFDTVQCSAKPSEDRTNWIVNLPSLKKNSLFPLYFFSDQI